MVSQWQVSQSQKSENGMEPSEGDPGEVNGKFSVLEGTFTHLLSLYHPNSAKLFTELYKFTFCIKSLNLKISVTNSTQWQLKRISLKSSLLLQDCKFSFTAYLVVM